ncbi:MAG: RNase adapter RapZ [Rhodospirillaceae bacterium]|jgi:RNase adapter protein RapZ|nr:RNase adapter RapZ [Rhodospirillaceae bacterium]MBT6243035.1 RNase adapter RapZ [Rhodospirillaceae bacterium]MBT7137163.1 RNase adapter RapZ [Rhodospirillaceae bacterium]
MTDDAISIPAFSEATPGKVLGVLLVTGMSGAGKTSALKALEDMGYEAIDNVPLTLLGALVKPPQQDGFQRPIAIGVDFRTRGFAIDTFISELDSMFEESSLEAKVLFIDCDDDELRRRYAETRHRHPLAQDRPVSDGIARERTLVSPLRDRADVVIDTTRFGPGELKRILSGHFDIADDFGLSVFVTSFSYRQGLPREADLVFDVRFLANPHYDPALKDLSGKDDAVGAFIAGDAGFGIFFDNLTAFLSPLLPRYAAEGKSYLTIALGCTGGRHRSVYVAEKLARWIEQEERQVHLLHRDLNKGTD